MKEEGKSVRQFKDEIQIKEEKQRAANDDGDIILGAFKASALMCEVDLHTHIHTHTRQ